jgi:uncharacterized protein (TIGR02001 family)
VTAGADRQGRRFTITASRRTCLAALIAGAIASAPAPAVAQIGAVVSIFTDDRFRGVSVSDGRPVGSLDLSYDAPNGMYASLSGTVVATRDEGLKPLSGVVNGGYAKRLRSGLTLDTGANYTRYSHYAGLSSGRDFAEFYAGLAGNNLAGRISVSPNYFGVPHWTAHGQADAHFDLSRNLTLKAEAGMLTPLGRSAYEGSLHTQFDGRVGIARRTGPLTLHAAISGRSGTDAIYSARGHGQFALVFGVSIAL